MHQKTYETRLTAQGASLSAKVGRLENFIYKSHRTVACRRKLVLLEAQLTQIHVECACDESNSDGGRCTSLHGICLANHSSESTTSALEQYRTRTQLWLSAYIFIACTPSSPISFSLRGSSLPPGNFSVLGSWLRFPIWASVSIDVE